MSLENYEPVAVRIDKFWKQYPNGRILTELVEVSNERIIAKASIYADRDDARPVATDFALEVQGSNNVNHFFHCEAAVTSAIGRALATFNFQGDPSKLGADARPSREEMSKVRQVSSNGPSQAARNPQTRVTTIQNPDAPATEKQIDAVRRMAHQLGKQITDAEVATMTKGQASDMFTTLQTEIANAKARQEDINRENAEEPF